MIIGHKHWEKIDVQSNSTSLTLDHQEHPLKQMNIVNLPANAAEKHDGKRKSITIKVLENAEGSSVTKTRRVVEFINQEFRSPFVSNNISGNTELEPILGYAQESLLPLSKACAPLVNIVENITFYVQIALDHTPELPPDGLTVDESAAIRLYTMEWEESNQSLYSMLNHTRKYRDRKQLVPYFKYMKLFITALVKLPCVPPLTIWRGVNRDISAEFLPGTSFTWWSFLSCTSELTVLENNIYLGKSGARTLFSIEAMNCRTIRDHSEYTTEDEVILLPGTQVIVQSQFMPASDLHIIHVKQVVTNEILLEPPFEGAKIYPKLKREWYRKKKYMIPMCLLAMLLIAGIIVGSVLGTRSHNQNAQTVGTIIWGGNNWAYSCDFHDDNIATVSTAGQDCGPACVNNPLCTHFTCSNLNGNLCQMKRDNASRQDAFYVNDQTGLCGVSYMSNYIIVNNNVSWWFNDTWTYACDFPGNDLSNLLSTSAGCYEECSRTPRCTHFMWYKYNGGTCYMKQDNVSNQDAVATNDANMICGIVVST